MMAIFLLCGCSTNISKVVLTMGFKPDEVFRIENISCMKPELMVYLTTMQNQYENVYGTDIWTGTTFGEELEENVKSNALAKMAQVKTMNLMASKYQVALDESELEKVHSIARMYYESLNDTEIEEMGVTQELIEQLYYEYATAQKVYEFIIRDINPEVSDDEARTIKIQYILVKTFALDGTGKKIEYTENAKKNALEKANEALELAKQGEDFDELIRKYSDDTAETLSFGKGEMEEVFEQAAFNLGNGEISDIVESSSGYNIIKCLSTFDKAETDINKIKIVDQKRTEVFGEQYDQFVESLTRRINDKVWNAISFIEDQDVTTDDFFEQFEENY